MTDINIHIVSTTLGSIGEITHELVERLEQDFKVTREWEFEIPESNDILLVHFLNKKVAEQPEVFNSFKTKILIQPVDGTSIQQKYVEQMNQFDLIITPADAGRNILLMNGVKKPITVIPNYIHNNLFKKEIYTGIDKYIPEDKFIFYHESSFDIRKGIDIMYEGFVRAFANTYYYDKVVLILKDLPFNKTSFLRNELFKKQTIQLQKKFKNPPLILKFSCYLSKNELKTLWNRTDAYVSCAHIEGFGIPLLRMAAMKKKILVLKNENSGYNSYLNSYNSVQIDTIQTNAEETIWLYDEKKSMWAMPNMNDVVEGFRKIHISEEKSSGLFIDKFLFENVYIKYKEKIIETFKNN